MVLAYLQSYAGDHFARTLLAINAGLRCAKITRTAVIKNLEQYRLNVRAIAELCAERGTKVVWIRDVIDDAMAARNPSFTRCQADVDRYSAVADEEMAARAVPSLDLHAMTLAPLR